MNPQMNQALSQLNKTIFLLGRAASKFFKAGMNICICIGLWLHTMMFPNNRM